MPKQLFYELTNDKQNKIISSARREFIKSKYSEASINQIVKNAGISRGSFYLYFENKDDLLYFILSKLKDEINNTILEVSASCNGNLFDMAISLFDILTKKFEFDEDVHLIKNVFDSNLDVFKESINKIINEREELLKKIIDFNMLKYKEDAGNIVDIVITILFSCVAKFNSKPEDMVNIRNCFLEKIELLRKVFSN